MFQSCSKEQSLSKQSSFNCQSRDLIGQRRATVVCSQVRVAGATADHHVGAARGQQCDRGPRVLDQTRRRRQGAAPALHTPQREHHTLAHEHHLTSAPTPLYHTGGRRRRNPPGIHSSVWPQRQQTVSPGAGARRGGRAWHEHAVQQHLPPSAVVSPCRGWGWVSGGLQQQTACQQLHQRRPPVLWVWGHPRRQDFSLLPQQIST